MPMTDIRYIKIIKEVYIFYVLHLCGFAFGLLFFFFLNIISKISRSLWIYNFSFRRDIVRFNCLLLKTSIN